MGPLQVEWGERGQDRQVRQKHSDLVISWVERGKREESKDDALASDLRRYPSSSQAFCQLLILDSDLLILVTAALSHSLS